MPQILASSNSLPERAGMAHFVLAMALYQTKQVAEAKAELTLGQALISQYCPSASGTISIAAMASKKYVYWYDWVIAQILQREAETMIQNP